jgi:hypothetical protein
MWRLLIGDSGKIAANMAMVIRTVIDGLHLAGLCTPYPSDAANLAERRVQKVKQGNNTHRRVDRLRTEVSQRKGSSKLPDERAFWELVRIVFTEQPKSAADVIRFCQVKLAIVTGFRIGENTTLPADWERWREYVDKDGRPAGEKGGIS